MAFILEDLCTLNKSKLPMLPPKGKDVIPQESIL